MMNDAERGYLAALIDGEGSIDWNGNYPRIRVANNNESLLLSLRTSYGGSVHADTVQRSDGRKRQPNYRWSLFGQDAVDLLISVRPMLRVRGDKADEVVHKWRTRGRSKKTQPSKVGTKSEDETSTTADNETD
jgi:hypothetical protein